MNFCEWINQKQNILRHIANSSVFQKYLFLILFLLVLLPAGAQNVVTGRVVDEGGEAVEFASVALRQGEKIVAGAMTGEDATFRISGSFRGDYTLTVSFVGFREERRAVSFSGEKKIDVGRIVLRSATEMLGEVTVTGEAAPKQVTVEKTTLSATTGAGAATGSILDILKSSASVSIDNADNVSIRGNGNVLILLDGVPTTLSSLNSIPSGNVQKIDIITSSDVKFDAEGTGGIINIISKRNAHSGMSGMAAFNFGFLEQMNGNLAFGVNKKKWDLRLNYNGMFNKDLVESTLQRQMKESGSSLGQSIESTQRKSNNVFGASGNYRATPRDVLNFNLRLLLPRINNFQDFHNVYDGGASEKFRQTDITFNRVNVEGSVGYKHKIKPDGEEINLLASVSKIKGDRPSFYYEGGQMIQKSESGGSPFLGSLQFDYMKSIGHGKLEAGAKMTYRQNDIDHKFYEKNFDTQQWDFSVPLSNDLLHREYIPAAYIQYSGKSSEKKFSYSTGLRFEASRTELSNRHDNLDESRMHYFLSPSLSLNYRPAEAHSFSFGLSRRITRPTYPQLNPYINLIDNQTYETGNVRLKPETVNKIDLGYGFSSKYVNLNAAIYLNFIHDYISQVVTFSDNKLIMTYINGDWDMKEGVELMLKIKPLEWLTLDINDNVYHTRSTGTFSGSDIANSGVVNSLNASLTLRPYNGANLQLQYFHTTPQHFPQFTTKTIQYFDLSLRQSILKDKLSLTAALTDVFNTRRWDIHSDNAVYRLSNYSKNRSRILWLGLSYNFNSFKPAAKKAAADDDRSVIRLGNL